MVLKSKKFTMPEVLQMEGKRKATDEPGAHGDGGGASGYGGNAIVINQLPMRRRARSFPPPFLMKTFEMVEAPETNSIISWSPNNTSFIIWDQIRFTAELLPKHFRHSNFSSFVYQLNNYGFKKISWEKFEYENPWFQAGKRHLLKNIKRRNQLIEYDIVIQPPSYGSSDDLLKDGMEEQLETLMTELHGSKVEIENLKRQQKEMENQFNTIEESIKVSQREKEEMVSQLLVQRFIQKIRERRKMSKNETAKKQELETPRNKEISLVLVAEGDSTRLNVDKNEQVQEEMMIIQPEGQTFSSPDNSGGSNQDEKATTTSDHAENCAFWKKMMEDDSECENGGAEQVEHHSKVIVKLEDLIASNTIMEGENLVEKALDRNIEDEGDLKLCT